MGTTGRETERHAAKYLDTRRGRQRLSRTLIGAVGALALCILVTASSATAKTVYPYEYAGFFDGTGSSKGQFNIDLPGSTTGRSGKI